MGRVGKLTSFYLNGSKSAYLKIIQRQPYSFFHLEAV